MFSSADEKRRHFGTSVECHKKELAASASTTATWRKKERDEALELVRRETGR